MRFNSAKWSWLIQLALFLAIFFGIQAWMTRDAPRGPAPALSGHLLNKDGQPVNLADYRGKPVLVHFWATWCPICKFSHSAIESVSGDYAVLTVAMQSGSDAEVHKYLKDAMWTAPVLNDASGKISSSWKVHGVPMNFIIDGEGNIRFVERGYTSSPGLRFRLWLASR